MAEWSRVIGGGRSSAARTMLVAVLPRGAGRRHADRGGRELGRGDARQRGEEGRHAQEGAGAGKELSPGHRWGESLRAYGFGEGLGQGSHGFSLLIQASHWPVSVPLSWGKVYAARPGVFVDRQTRSDIWGACRRSPGLESRPPGKPVSRGSAPESIHAHPRPPHPTHRPAFLTAVEAFAGLDAEARNDLLAAAQRRRVAAGAIIFHQGDEAQAFFVLLADGCEPPS